MRLHLASIASIATTAALLLANGVAHAADPATADCLAASDTSLELGNQHKLRSKRSQLLICAAPSCPADIRKECAHAVDEVNGQIPTIVFQVKDPSGGDLSAVKVTMDGEVLAERLEGTSLSVDPGEHVFTFETAGQPPLSKRFLIQEGHKDRRELVTLGMPSVVPAAPAPPGTASTGQQVSAQLPAATSKRASGGGPGAQRVLALVAGGVGVVGLGVGAGFGILAMSQKDEAQSACPGAQCANQEGANKWSTAGATGNVSTIGFIVGGVLLAGAAALWLAAPSASNAQVGLGLGTLQVKVTW